MTYKNRLNSGAWERRRQFPNFMKTETAAETRSFPRNSLGQAVSRGPCGVCGYGMLQYEGEGFWICDGLSDPEKDDQPLRECPRYHQDGEEPYKTPSIQSAKRGGE